jgi:hypothetical protein
MKLKPHAGCAVCRYWLARAEEDRSHSLKGDADSRRTELRAKSELDDHLARTANLVKVGGDNAKHD